MADYESVEVTWTSEGLPATVRADSLGADFVVVNEITYNELIRIRWPDRSHGWVRRIDFLMTNERIGRLERSGSQPDWRFADLGISPRRQQSS